MLQVASWGRFQMVNIIPPIGPTGRVLSVFSIGFANLITAGEHEDVVAAGSGALVTVGAIQGILTAAHVLEALPTQGRVGLIRYTSTPVIHKQTIEMAFTEKLIIRGSGSESDGPDLGFLRLAPDQVATLNATNVFFNLSKRAESILGNRFSCHPYFEGVCGIVAEWTIDDTSGEAGRGRLKGFRGLFGVGKVSGTREVNGYDLVSFETDRRENEEAPSDYKGVSGAALWRVYFTRDSDNQLSVSDKAIFGVAFHQSQLIDGMRTISCHGPKSVYDILLRKIVDRWPHAG